MKKPQHTDDELMAIGREILQSNGELAVRDLSAVAAGDTSRLTRIVRTVKREQEQHEELLREAGIDPRAKDLPAALPGVLTASLHRVAQVCAVELHRVRQDELARARVVEATLRVTHEEYQANMLARIDMAEARAEETMRSLEERDAELLRVRADLEASATRETALLQQVGRLQADLRDERAQRDEERARYEARTDAQAADLARVDEEREQALLRCTRLEASADEARFAAAAETARADRLEAESARVVAQLESDGAAAAIRIRECQEEAVALRAELATAREQIAALTAQLASAPTLEALLQRLPAPAPDVDERPQAASTDGQSARRPKRRLKAAV